ncbi:heme transporter [Gordonia sp. TBRC 11910]|uniref:Heme transporter n=1 Tax=Gordonia asplenii TaxID=2725283 RepID=A0A848L366_9ACTN|nr:ChuX/HutX family heme-like substrate-binding protein [Gordonia asplenii]NMO04957.1 heme transporter [Gordonia asplenii]
MSAPHDSAATNDLDELLSTPDFAGQLLRGCPGRVARHLPLLDQVVGVTVAGPVIMNDVGVYADPTGMGGPIRCQPSQITVRLNASHLRTALITEPAGQGMPATLRFFDADGGCAHVTYLTDRSDRLAFESLTLAGYLTPITGDDLDAHPLALRFGQFDQLDQFDSVLFDGGPARLRSLPQPHSGATQVPLRRVIGALSHAALLSMPATLVAGASGCLQMRSGLLTGSREHEGSMVLASGSGRTMIDFSLLKQAWVTWANGACGRTGSIELYDDSGRCRFIATQTGPQTRAAAAGWEQLMGDIVDDEPA